MIYAGITILLLVVEVLIALFMHGNFIRGTLGDVLVVMLIYAFIRIIIPDKLKLLPLYVFLFACITEFLQAIHIVELLGLQDNSFFRILIGSVFDWLDILAYGIGCIILEALERLKFIKIKKEGYSERGR